MSRAFNQYTTGVYVADFSRGSGRDLLVATIIKADDGYRLYFNGEFVEGPFERLLHAEYAAEERAEDYWEANTLDLASRLSPKGERRECGGGAGRRERPVRRGSPAARQSYALAAQGRGRRDVSGGGPVGRRRGRRSHRHRPGLLMSSTFSGAFDLGAPPKAVESGDERAARPSPAGKATNPVRTLEGPRARSPVTTVSGEEAPSAATEQSFTAEPPADLPPLGKARPPSTAVVRTIDVAPEPPSAASDSTAAELAATHAGRTIPAPAKPGLRLPSVGDAIAAPANARPVTPVPVAPADVPTTELATDGAAGDGSVERDSGSAEEAVAERSSGANQATGDRARTLRELIFQ